MEKIKKFLSAINSYFFNLTKANWGAPYHFILAVWLVRVLILIGVAVNASMVVTFFVGVIYGIYQLRKGTDTPDKALQDWLFEIAGILTAGLL